MVAASTVILALFAIASSSFAYDGCNFDGRLYQVGDIIEIPKCLGRMRCLGHDNLEFIEPAKNCKRDGQSGCWFDGRVYNTGEIIVIEKCLGQMECLGNNNLGPIEEAKNCETKRQADGQTGCFYDGRVYEVGDKIIIAHCLAEYTCLGHNNLGQFRHLDGICPEDRS